MWANSAFISLTAKNRPGLISSTGWVTITIIHHRKDCLPCVFTQSKSQMFAGRGHRLMSARLFIVFTLAKLRKPKSVKFFGIWINTFICMSCTGRDGDKCACRNSHTIGKGEWAQRDTCQSNWGEAGSKLRSHTGDPGKEFNERRADPSTRWVSRMKLSILCILSIPAFVQPSPVITASTS